MEAGICATEDGRWKIKDEIQQLRSERPTEEAKDQLKKRETRDGRLKTKDE